MNEARIALYLDLIQRLLSCPSREQPKILQAHRELWDEDFVMVLRGVAGQMREHGQENRGEFLISLAEQLAEALGMRRSEGRGQDYLRFLIEVLQTVADSGGNPQVVHPLLEKNVDKLDDHFRRTLHNRGKEILQAAAPEEARVIGGVIGKLASLIQQFNLGRRANNLEIAITSYELLTIAFPRESQAETWATTQNNLAAAYSDRINGSRAENLERAIRFYGEALTIKISGRI